MRAWISRVAKWIGRWTARPRRALGLRGERLAARYLRGQGLVIVGRRERLRFGELDLVAVEGRTVVFVEVKTRRRRWPDQPRGVVLSHRQQCRIVRAAHSYRKRFRLLRYPARFDLITIYWPRGGSPEILHYRHVFEDVLADEPLRR